MTGSSCVHHTLGYLHTTVQRIANSLPVQHLWFAVRVTLNGDCPLSVPNEFMTEHTTRILNQRSKAIIAVFGGNDPSAIEAARTVGASIAQQGHILLTGGSTPGNSAVKNSAIAGAQPSPWIGIERGDSIKLQVAPDHILVVTDIGHRRNYLEACLCDCAVAFHGGDGTASEVVFSLSLKKPVAFVGDFWRKRFHLDDPSREAILSLMIDAAFRRIGADKSGNPTLDRLLTKDAIRTSLTKGLPPYKYFDLDKTGDVVPWLSSKTAMSNSLTGSFPAIEGYESVSQAYHEWICSIATGQPTGEPGSILPSAMISIAGTSDHLALLRRGAVSGGTNERALPASRKFASGD
jgi:predicted Rossmann-fold nucleotide-binding protein